MTFSPPNLRLGLCFIFLSANLAFPQAQAGEVVLPFMPKPGTMVNISLPFTPAHLKGIVVHPGNALQFDFMIHKGDGNLTDAQKNIEYTKLIKYFLASLTVPEKDQWVNLSPYEKNRIINDNFGQTDMGRDLLSQDYLLKQIASSLMYPESGLGKTFWSKVYARAYQEQGHTNIPVQTINKVWIVPDEAEVYESGNTAYVVKSHLKVMLEEDYIALDKGNKIAPQGTAASNTAAQLIRDIILPELEREVNTGKNFAQLHQILSGMVLATWYKKALRESLLGKVYVDRAKIKGIHQNPQANQEIYEQYLFALKKGAYNYIKDDFDPHSKHAIPRKYFAGGYSNDLAQVTKFTKVSEAVLEEKKREGFISQGDLAFVALDEQRPTPDMAMMITSRAVTHMMDGARQAVRELRKDAQYRPPDLLEYFNEGLKKLSAQAQGNDRQFNAEFARMIRWAYAAAYNINIFGDNIEGFLDLEPGDVLSWHKVPLLKKDRDGNYVVHSENSLFLYMEKMAEHIEQWFNVNGTEQQMELSEGVQRSIGDARSFLDHVTKNPDALKSLFDMLMQQIQSAPEDTESKTKFVDFIFDELQELVFESFGLSILEDGEKEFFEVDDGGNLKWRNKILATYDLEKGSYHPEEKVAEQFFNEQISDLRNKFGLNAAMIVVGKGVITDLSGNSVALDPKQPVVIKTTLTRNRFRMVDYAIKNLPNAKDPRAVEMPSRERLYKFQGTETQVIDGIEQTFLVFETALGPAGQVKLAADRRQNIAAHPDEITKHKKSPSYMELLAQIGDTAREAKPSDELATVGRRIGGLTRRRLLQIIGAAGTASIVGSTPAVKVANAVVERKDFFSSQEPAAIALRDFLGRKLTFTGPTQRGILAAASSHPAKGVIDRLTMYTNLVPPALRRGDLESLQRQTVQALAGIMKVPSPRTIDFNDFLFRQTAPFLAGHNIVLYPAIERHVVGGQPLNLIRPRFFEVVEFETRSLDPDHFWTDKTITANLIGIALYAQGPGRALDSDAFMALGNLFYQPHLFIAHAQGALKKPGSSYSPILLDQFLESIKNSDSKNWRAINFNQRIVDRYQYDLARNNQYQKEDKELIVYHEGDHLVSSFHRDQVIASTASEIDAMLSQMRNSYFGWAEVMKYAHAAVNGQYSRDNPHLFRGGTYVVKNTVKYLQAQKRKDSSRFPMISGSRSYEIIAQLHLLKGQPERKEIAEYIYKKHQTELGKEDTSWEFESEGWSLERLMQAIKTPLGIGIGSVLGVGVVLEWLRRRKNRLADQEAKAAPKKGSSKKDRAMAAPQRPEGPRWWMRVENILRLPFLHPHQEFFPLIAKRVVTPIYISQGKNQPTINLATHPMFELNNWMRWPKAGYEATVSPNGSIRITHGDREWTLPLQAELRTVEDQGLIKRIKDGNFSFHTPISDGMTSLWARALRLVDAAGRYGFRDADYFPILLKNQDIYIADPRDANVIGRIRQNQRDGTTEILGEKVHVDEGVFVPLVIERDIVRGAIITKDGLFIFFSQGTGIGVHTFEVPIEIRNEVLMVLLRAAAVDPEIKKFFEEKIWKVWQHEYHFRDIQKGISVFTNLVGHALFQMKNGTLAINIFKNQTSELLENIFLKINDVLKGKKDLTEDFIKYLFDPLLRARPAPFRLNITPGDLSSRNGYLLFNLRLFFDAAMDVKAATGGIDMNAANMNLTIKRDGKGVPLPLAQQDMAQLSQIPGFVPRIIEIRPASNASAP